MKKNLKLIPLILITIAVALTPLEVKALNGSEFKAGRIIDDVIFTNKNSMSVNQVQAFLNAKLPSCDRWHASSNPNYQPPYTCLNEYQENTNTGESNYGRFNGDGTPYQVPGGISAAQIIWNAGQNYNINPQVLIVLLQKEQSLITDNWPWLIQYQKAAGYLCPDTAPCDSSKAGFYRQIDGAAWQFRHDFNGIDTPGYWAPYGKGWNNILFSPNSSCGTKSVYIENQATAVLYKYTPYTPNDAALNNLYGTGDGCSAYGNRNFWRLFNDWFGSTIDPFENSNIKLSSSLNVNPQEVHKNEPYQVTFSITNTADYPIYIGSPMVVVRGPQGQNRDVPLDKDITIAAKSTYTYNKTWLTIDSGWHQFNIVTYSPSYGYLFSYPSIEASGIVRESRINVLP